MNGSVLWTANGALAVTTYSSDYASLSVSILGGGVVEKKDKVYVLVTVFFCCDGDTTLGEVYDFTRRFREDLAPKQWASEGLLYYFRYEVAAGACAKAMLIEKVKQACAFLGIDYYEPQEVDELPTQ